VFEISVDPPPACGREGMLRIRGRKRLRWATSSWPIDGSEMFGHLAPWDNQCTPTIMTMSAALAESWARAMGPVRTRPSGPRMQTEGKKRSPHSGRARSSVGHSRAPFRASPIVAEKTRPQGCSPKTSPKDRRGDRAAPSLITKVLATHRV
jgi:hypothetical protein